MDFTNCQIHDSSSSSPGLVNLMRIALTSSLSVIQSWWIWLSWGALDLISYECASWTSFSSCDLVCPGVYWIHVEFSSCADESSAVYCQWEAISYLGYYWYAIWCDWASCLSIHPSWLDLSTLVVWALTSRSDCFRGHSHWPRSLHAVVPHPVFTWRHGYHLSELWFASWHWALRIDVLPRQND